MDAPSIVVTLSNPERAADRALAEMKNRRYLEALERSGAAAVPLDERTDSASRQAALAAMDGLLITGGADIDPARYRAPMAGSRQPDPARDDLDAAAFEAARQAGVPVLGICRGLQALNVFSGGALLQDVDGHEGEPYPSPAAGQHSVDLLPGSRLASIVGEPGSLHVNSYHHQAVTADRLAPGLRAVATARHGDDVLVEALESADPDRWLVGIQCHPERTESSPPVLERLWTAFVAAARAHRSRPAVVPQPDADRIRP